MNNLSKRIENSLYKFTNYIRSIKRIPPILYPIWAVFAVIGLMYKTILWLFGKWHCEMCGKRYGIVDRRYKRYLKVTNIVTNKTSVQTQKICEACRSNLPQEEQTLLQEE